jgi:hypothetical protein
MAPADTRAGAVNAASSVTHAQLTTRLDKFTTDLNTKLNAAIAAAIDSAISDWKVSLEETKNDFEELVKLSNETIAALNSRIVFLENAAKAQVLWNNDKGQRLRGRSFRLHNHRSDAKDAPTSMKDTFEFIIKPAFQKAVECGDLESIPSLQGCGEFGHRLRVKKEGDVATVIFKFTSRFYFHIFLKHGRALVDDMNRTRGPLERLRLSKDLTFWNRRAMSYLFKHDLTDKCRLSGTQVQFTFKAEPDKWLTVLDPTASCIADMQKKVLCPFVERLSPAEVSEDGAVAIPAVGAVVAVEDAVDGFQPAA